MNTTQRKKRPTATTAQEKARIWEMFAPEINKSKIECIFSQTQKEEEEGEPVHHPDQCIKCGAITMLMEEGFPTCTNMQCGHIVTDTLDYSPEWRFFGADDKNANDPTRCGNPINPLLVESSYGCKVICTSKSSPEMKRVGRWASWMSMPHKEKSLYDVFQFITVMAQNSGIPKIFIDEAMVIYKDISEQQIFRGINRDGIKAASIYISCRLNGCPRTSHEIAEIFKLDKAAATNGCSKAMTIINNIDRGTTRTDTTMRSSMCSTAPSQFIERYCTKLNLPTETVMLARFVAAKLEKDNVITDNTPQSIAAGIVYFIGQVCGLGISKVDINKVCGVSEVTINKCYKKMDAIKDRLVPASMLRV